MELNSIKKQNLNFIFLVFFFFGFLIKLTISALYYTEFDTFWYLSWAKQLQNGFFTCYDTVSNLDYPPLYLYPLYIVGFFYKFEIVSTNKQLVMLLLKFVPVLFDMLVGLFLYKLFSKKSIVFGSFIALLWLFNPSITFNSSFWGQTDSIMIFELLLCFYLLRKKRYELGCAVYVLALSTKLQVLFFAPIVFFELIKEFDIKRIIKSALISVGVFFAIFLPFIIKSGIGVIEKIYFGGFGSYPFCNLNSFNIYGLFDLNFKKDDIQILPFLDLHTLSVIIMMLSVFFVFYLYYKLKNPPIFLIGFLFMEILFLFTTRMHERYQIVAVGFILMEYAFSRKKQLLNVFFLTSLITFLNQALLLTKANSGLNAWNLVWNNVLFFFSAINIAFFVYSFIVVIKIILKGKENFNEKE